MENGSTHQYYYLTRFMFAFVLIGGFFAALALILGILAICSKIVSFADSALCSVALFFQTITAALMTYVPPRPFPQLPFMMQIHPFFHH